MKIEIKNRFTGAVIFAYEKENNTIKDTVEEAIRLNVSLEFADLRNCDLRNCDFRNCDLKNCNLENADLRNCDFRNAYLKNCDLKNADFRNCDFRNANLESADLTDFKEDFFEILSKAPNEIGGLKKALINGNINGSTYEGDCCCLVGTIANVRGCDYANLEGIIPNDSRPAERWFFGIKVGDTPKNSKIAKITLDWINEYETLKNK